MNTCHISAKSLKILTRLCLLTNAALTYGLEGLIGLRWWMLAAINTHCVEIRGPVQFTECLLALCPPNQALKRPWSQTVRQTLLNCRLWHIAFFRCCVSRSILSIRSQNFAGIAWQDGQSRPMIRGPRANLAVGLFWFFMWKIAVLWYFSFCKTKLNAWSLCEGYGFKTGLWLSQFVNNFKVGSRRLGFLIF